MELLLLLLLLGWVLGNQLSDNSTLFLEEGVVT